MIEVNFLGVQLPWLLLLAAGALPCSWATRRLLAIAGAYRWIWHPALFDLALYVLVLGALAYITGATATSS
jgi:protein-S-isoprenylcysteine O-methyltransferase Ste14